MKPTQVAAALAATAAGLWALSELKARIMRPKDLPPVYRELVSMPSVDVSDSKLTVVRPLAPKFLGCTIHRPQVGNTVLVLTRPYLSPHQISIHTLAWLSLAVCQRPTRLPSASKGEGWRCKRTYPMTMADPPLLASLHQTSIVSGFVCDRSASLCSCLAHP